MGSDKRVVSLHACVCGGGRDEGGWEMSGVWGDGGEEEGNGVDGLGVMGWGDRGRDP